MHLSILRLVQFLLDSQTKHSERPIMGDPNLAPQIRTDHRRKNFAPFKIALCVRRFRGAFAFVRVEVNFA